MSNHYLHALLKLLLFILSETFFPKTQINNYTTDATNIEYFCCYYSLHFAGFSFNITLKQNLLQLVVQEHNVCFGYILLFSILH